jgi:hypothetical protein
MRETFFKKHLITINYLFFTVFGLIGWYAILDPERMDLSFFELENIRKDFEKQKTKEPLLFNLDDFLIGKSELESLQRELRMLSSINFFL